MTKNPEDDKLVIKGKVKEVLHKQRGSKYAYLKNIKAIDQLPAEPPRKARPDKEIERAISKLLDEAREHQHADPKKFLALIPAVDLVFWCLPFLEEKLGWRQLTYTDKELLRKEKKP